jgi:hypothetical protein
MPLSTEDIYEKALTMSSNVEDNFLELGRRLRQLQDRDPELFQKVVEKSDLGLRKAYYLVEVSKTFDPLPISRARLRKLGWTKLQIIGKHVTKDNVEELVELAESLPAKQLERQMRGETPVKNAHCVLMYFSPKQYAELEQALLKNGATRSTGKGRGLQNKEEALINVIRKAAKATGKATHEPPHESD